MKRAPTIALREAGVRSKATRLVAARDLEIADSGMPVERRDLVRNEVFVDIPERTVVRRINRHTRVIAPLNGIALVACAVVEGELSGT